MAFAVLCRTRSPVGSGTRTRHACVMAFRSVSLGRFAGPGVSTAHGAVEVRVTQPGFPAELTSSWDASTGYSWKMLAPLGLVPADPGIQLAGDNAITLDGDETLTTGTRVWLERDPSDSTKLLITGGAAGNSSLLSCSPFASLEPTSCIQMSVRGTPAGRCSDVSTGQSITLIDYDDEDGVWESAEPFSTDTDSWDVLYDWPTGAEPRLRFSNGVDTVTLRFMGCNGGKFVFLGSGVLLCGADPDTDVCAENSFLVELECALCPNPDYDGPGWYCVGVSGCTSGHSKSCQYLEADPGVSTLICSGPHADEATCLASCETPETITFCEQPDIPSTLFFTITGVSGAGAECPLSLVGMMVEMVWNGVDKFVGTESSSDCGEGGTVLVEMACDDWPDVQVNFTILGGSSALVTSNLPMPASSSAPFLLNGTLTANNGGGTCCNVFTGGTIDFTITE